MDSLHDFLHVSENLIYHRCRAKYYLINGKLKLASVQYFSDQRFKESGWELYEPYDDPNECSVPDAESLFSDEKRDSEKRLPSDVERATRRARKHALDLIMCNGDLDVFVTLTYSPESVSDKADYDECYSRLRVWLSNRVTRNDLKYVLVPERTKAGDIHFHALMNSDALKLVRATNANTGRPLSHNGKPIYNLSDWSFGFSTAEYITRLSDDNDERTAVAKYIFKYMGKQSGQKIGGRYCLAGGLLEKPVFVLGEEPEEFFGEDEPVYTNVVELDNGLVFKEWSFI